METIKMTISGGDNPHIKGKVTMGIKLPIIDAYWTNMEDQKIDRAQLEEKVKFYIITENVNDNTNIKLKLYDHDLLTPDDDKFNNQEEIRNVQVKGNKAVLELELKREWEKDIKEEVLKYRSLYWEATIYNSTFDIGSQIKVTCSERNIFVNSSQYDKTLPEVYTLQGEEISYITTEAVKEGAEKGAEKGISKIAIAKIGKGNMGANTGQVYGSTTAQGTQRQVSPKEVYTNAGEKIKIKIGKNFTTQTKAGQTITTKGISQYDFFMENGFAVKILKPLQHIPFISDLFDVANFAMGVNSGKPTPIPMGGLEVLADYLTKDTKAFMEQQMYNNMQIAKEKGVEEVKKEIVKCEYIPGDKFPKYYSREISQSTAMDILSGEISNWSQVKLDLSGAITLLYIWNRVENMYTIETFFIKN